MKDTVIFYTDASYNPETKTADFGGFYLHENYRFYDSLPNYFKDFIETEHMAIEKTSTITKNKFESSKLEDIIFLIYSDCQLALIKWNLYIV
jgi:hypothetical protein